MELLKRIEQTSLEQPELNAFESSDFILDGESGGGYTSLTYKELWIQSGILASFLIRTVGSGKTIAVYGHKSPLMIVCFLAALRSGNSYCPIDISVPIARRKIIYDKLNPSLILALEDIDDYTDCDVINKSRLCKILALTEEASTVNKIDTSIDASSDSTAYIIFTSGSTGIPKGVQITRNCLDNFLAWGATLVDNNTKLRFLNQAPYSFDLSVMDTYISLYTGGTVVAMDKAVQNSYPQMMKFLRASNVNVWVSTPSFAELCLADKELNHNEFCSIEYFLLCGETLTVKTARKLLDRFPDVKLYNTYGPTESTVAVTGIQITKEICDKYSSFLPIGIEKPNTYIDICDENGALLRDGEKGGIVITGDSVSIGYLRDKERTTKSFSTKIKNGILYRSYKTGDEGFRFGNILWCTGRIDLQIKFHGYRIEIEDIENNVLKLEYINQVGIIALDRDGKTVGLVAFITLTVPDKDLNDSRIHNDLLAFLPEYMIPKKFVIVDHLPLTNNGKLDRNALREMWCQ